MYCLHCKYTTKLRNDKEINALFALYKGCSGLHCTNQARSAPTKQPLHPPTEFAEFTETSC